MSLLTTPNPDILKLRHTEIKEKLMAVDESTLDIVTGGIAIAILLGGMLMMFTTVFTTKSK
jgi:hypothetical protein